MSERKVLNKYYPPDFDPSKIPRRSAPKNAQQVVRLMAPFSMRCNTCGEYVYKGKKFNARKETVEGEDYYGIKIFRFYIKCTLCSAEITFKTDPKNTDYLAEHGASRNFEPWREVTVVEEEDRLAKLEEEENNPMKVLENRTTDSKREMDILDALQDIRARNARNERVQGTEGAQEALDARIEVMDEEEERQKKEVEEDEAVVRMVFSRVVDPTSSAGAGPSSSSMPPPPPPAGFATFDAGDEENGDVEVDPSIPSTPATSVHSSLPSTITIKRKADFLEPEFGNLLSEAAKAALPKSTPPVKKKKKEMASALGIKRVTKTKTKA